MAAAQVEELTKVVKLDQVTMGLATQAVAQAAQLLPPQGTSQLEMVVQVFLLFVI